MTFIMNITDGKTNSFINKKTQMYSLFSVMFDFSEEGIDITQQMKEIFFEFIQGYSMFKNEYEIECDTEDEQQTVEVLKRYKLASSEGVNKLNNRMIRYEILKKLFLNEVNVTIDSIKRIEEKMETLAKTENETFE